VPFCTHSSHSVRRPSSRKLQRPSPVPLTVALHLVYGSSDFSAVTSKKVWRLMASRTIFVSHAHVDNELCDRFVAALRRMGFDVWYDRINLQVGQSLSRDIERELLARSTFLVLLTPASVSSYWVKLETYAYLNLVAHESARLLIPVRIAPVEVPLLLRGFTWIDGVGASVQATAERVAFALMEPASYAPLMRQPPAGSARPIPPPRGLRQLRIAWSSQPGRMLTTLSALIIVAVLAAVLVRGPGRGQGTGAPGEGATQAPGGVPTATLQVGPPSSRCFASGSTPAPSSTSNDLFQQYDLAAVAAVSPYEAWAVGDDGTAVGNGVILHYCDNAWTQVLGPVNGQLMGISMLSPDAGWAVGGSRGIGGQDTIIQYVNGAWTLDRAPTALVPGNGALSARLAPAMPAEPQSGEGEPALLSVSMVSATEGWAMGLNDMLHYHDGTWAPVAYPSLPSGSASSRPVMLSVDMISPTDGWAVGTPDGFTEGQGNNGVILHYLNGSWTLVSSPVEPDGLSSVAMVSPSEGWAVGGGGVILHYANGRWTQQTSPTTAGLNDVDMVSSTVGWAVGFSTILQYANGKWTQVYSGPAPLNAVSMTSASSGWAVGAQGSILHYDGSTWG
jgi:hypothetical protein